MSPILVILSVLVFLTLLSLLGLRGLVYTCSPNEVLIFSGRKRRLDGRTYGFRVIKGGTGLKLPLVERVDRMDLTNMVIDLVATNAYSKGGVPLTVQGVANVKIAGHEPLLNNAIERFLGKSRQELMMVAKATLEGSVRGILATMTPEQVNEDKILFSERLVSEVEQDMTALGLVVDTMKIQNVQDDVRYLESIGRRRNAEVLSTARIAEAIAKSDSMVRSAENREREEFAAVAAQTDIIKAEAAKKLMDVQTRRAALVAEEQAQVAAMVAKTIAELEVQKARLEQVRQQLQADVIAPAEAGALASEENAKSMTASIVEDGKARADALRRLATTFKAAGPRAREVMLVQKLESVMNAMANVIPDTHVEKVTMIDGSIGNGLGKMIGMNEQIKQVLGVDLVEKVKSLGEPRPVELRMTPSAETEQTRSEP